MSDLPTKAPCTECGCLRIYHKTWDRLSLERRAELRQDNRHNRASSSGLCHRCHERKRRRDRAVPSSGEPMPADLLLQEWEQLGDSTRPLMAECERLAPRLGMNPRSMETALRRAGVRSRFGPAGANPKRLEVAA